MTVAVDIANSALIKLGQSPIQSLTEDVKQAKLCNLQYQKIVNRMLRAHPWTFAVQRAALTPIVSPLEFGDENVFSIPADCLRVLGISSGSCYTIEQNYLLTSDANIELRYISEQVPEEYFDTNFQEAASSALAADLCYALTNSTSLKQLLIDEAEFWVSQARSFSAQEISPENYTHSFPSATNARVIGSQRDFEIKQGFKVP